MREGKKGKGEREREREREREKKLGKGGERGRRINSSLFYSSKSPSIRVQKTLK
jgi:hypothetical protein